MAPYRKVLVWWDHKQLSVCVVKIQTRHQGTSGEGTTHSKRQRECKSFAENVGQHGFQEETVSPLNLKGPFRVLHKGFRGRSIPGSLLKDVESRKHRCSCKPGSPAWGAECRVGKCVVFFFVVVGHYALTNILHWAKFGLPAHPAMCWSKVGFHGISPHKELKALKEYTTPSYYLAPSWNLPFFFFESS